MSWLHEHLQTFVKPYLGFIPEVSPSDEPYFLPAEMTLLKAVLRSVKREAQKCNLGLLFTGRDMWVMHVLACRDGVPHVYRPDICRVTKTFVKDNYRDFFCLDTGYAGSIPKALGCKAYALIQASEAGGTNVVHMFGYQKPPHGWDTFHRPLELLKLDYHQVLPRNKAVRQIAARLETSPKYWTGADYVDPASVATWCNAELERLQKQNWNATSGIRLPFVHQNAFVAAAKLTIQVYRDKSPAFVGNLVDTLWFKTNRMNPRWISDHVQ